MSWSSILRWLSLREVRGLNPARPSGFFGHKSFRKVDPQKRGNLVRGFEEIVCENNNNSSLLSMAPTLKSTWATLEGHKGGEEVQILIISYIKP